MDEKAAFQQHVNDPWVRNGTKLVMLLLLAGAVLRTCGIGNWDWQTLLFLFAAGILPLLRWATKLKLTKEGLELQLPETIRDLGIGGKRTTLDKTSPNLMGDHDDPQKGRWGGMEVNNDRRISATVNPIPGTPDWFAVRLIVSSTNAQKPLQGTVTFHLHPTFKNETPVVPVREGKSELELVAWGAFTVGAECDGGLTKLELDLATLPDAPELFRCR